MTPALILVALGAAACEIGGWLYFERARMPRPPIGVFDLSDVFIIFALIIIIPILYLILSNWLVMALLTLAEFSLIYFVFEPLMPRVWVWLLTILLIGADVAAGFALGTTAPAYLAVNDLVIILSAISIANTWAQGGMKARDAAILGSLLIGYDFVTTVHFSLMNDLLLRLSALPLTPLFAWGEGSKYAAIGLGDLIMMTVVPLTMRRTFGIRAGQLALGIDLTVVIVLIVSPVKGIFPVLVALGPVILLQYVYWRVAGPYGPKRDRRWRASKSRFG